MNPARRGSAERQKIRLFRKFLQLAAAILVVSLVSVGVGIAAVAAFRSDFPYNCGGALMAGAPAFFMAFCSLFMFFEAKKSGYASDHTTRCFDFWALMMIFWLILALLNTLFGFGVSGIYGVVACASNSKVCQENARSKFVLSIVTILLTGILFILTSVLWLTCCCNAKAFGVLKEDICVPRLGPICDTTETYRAAIRQAYRAAADRRQIIQDIPLPEIRMNDQRLQPDASNAENIARDALEHLVGNDPEEWSDDHISTDLGVPPSYRDLKNVYADEPPSYEEVMKTDIQQYPVLY